jgi:7,8-dihydropterin-6-yl-methyl-4-(beta-D-ribofuranosyl)aminobenzene 5'-phosphate synthase
LQYFRILLSGVRLKITVLVENSVGDERLLAEHGLSFWIEVGDCRILFDAGQSDIILHNAAELGVSLEAADAVVLSHGHYDHTGGIPALLNLGGTPRIFVHPDAFGIKYSGRSAESGHYVGMSPETAEALRQGGPVVDTVSPTEVCNGFFVTGEIPRVTDFEDTGGWFFSDESYAEKDPLIDDQAGYIDTPDGLVVVLGCAHAGVINTLQYIRKLVPGRPILALIGGMHLSHARESRLDSSIKVLRELDIKHIFPLHCTGDYAVKRLKNELGSRVELCSVGTVLNL